MSWDIMLIPESVAQSSSQEPPVIQVICAKIEPQLANILVRQLSRIVPLENLKHVKRIRKRIIEGQTELSIILCPTIEGENHFEGIPHDVARIIATHQLTPFVTNVSAFAASSKDEWQDQCKLWPTSYHPNSNGSIPALAMEESLHICNFMKLAIELSKEGRPDEQAVNAAIIVDPSNKQVIASACDECLPLMANRCCLNMLIPDHAKTTGSLSSAAACLHPWSWIQPRASCVSVLGKRERNPSWHPLRHAAMVAIENAASRDRRLFPLVPDDQSLPEHKLPSLGFTAGGLVDHKTETVGPNGLHMDPSKPYLCTGYDIYLVWEPCSMCAMALVHQRLCRVFYAFPNPNAGALGSIHRLHGEKSLNHHYSVFRVLVQNEGSDD